MAEPILRAVIVDDEAPARSLLREYLAAHPGVEIVAECANGFEAVKAIGELSPDLVFLDVQMPKLDGFEVLELIETRPAVVFCTAYDEFALRAFEVHAVDYLLKPFGRDRLAEALARARARWAAGHAGSKGSAVAATGSGPAVSATRLASAARGPERRLERIVVKDGAKVHVIPIHQLDSAEAADDYVSLHAGGKTYLKHQTLADLEAALDGQRFVRVHRSHLVALDRIARIEPYAKDSRIAVLRDGREIPVSRSGYARLRELMDV
jgi:two-component system LytT family response regulator